MQSDNIITVDNLCKVYQIYDRPIDRLKESLHPLRKQYHKEFYALKGISFEIKRGEAVGIVGKNGSGKSTLLKIITGVLMPTSGTVEVKGRISALLELGAGFNPDFTGLENIYLSGAIMGYSKEEIQCRLDDILSFADIGLFVNQPVKTYSSGMMVRLAFALQTQVQPDIFIVDEALAVGDALFQKRCFQKIEELIANGTTLLFVSHDQEIVRTMTQRAILLANGECQKVGTSSDIVLEYRKLLHEEEKTYLQRITREYNQLNKTQNDNKKEIVQTYEISRMSEKMSFGSMEAEILSVQVLDEQGIEKTFFYPGDVVKIAVTCIAHKELDKLSVGIRLRNKEGVKIYSWGTLNQDIEIWSGKKGEIFWSKIFLPGQTFTVIFEAECMLGANLYEIQANISQEEDCHYLAQRMLHWRDEAEFFTVHMKRQEYFFGGVCDLKMKANY